MTYTAGVDAVPDGYFAWPSSAGDRPIRPSSPAPSLPQLNADPPPTTTEPMQEQSKRDAAELNRFRQQRERKRERRRQTREQLQAQGPLDAGLDSKTIIDLDSASEADTPRASVHGIHTAGASSSGHHTHHAPKAGVEVEIDGDRLIINGTVLKMSNLAERTLTLTPSGVIVGAMAGKAKVEEKQKGTRAFHKIGIAVVVILVLNIVFGTISFSFELGRRQ